MRLEDFKSGTYKEQYKYKSFTPALVNHGWTWEDAKINTLLERATIALSELNAFSRLVPDIDMFIEMHIAKEANTSSRIEGTRTEIDEVLMQAENISPEKRDDRQEVQNYIKAMNMSVAELGSLPLASRMLKNTHNILMQSVRGENKTPGEFRKTQNWIGGTSLTDAFFIPPAHGEVEALMSDLEKFWHNERIDVPQLIRIAISHYQFETIHPFLDGNGRVGRLLITLFLVNKGFLKNPCLYLSDYLEKNKGAYYDALTVVRASNNMIHWIKFFLLAIASTAEKGRLTFEKILELKMRTDTKIVALGRRARSADLLVRMLYKKPLIEDLKIVEDNLGLNKSAVRNLIKVMEEIGILKEITGHKRNRIYIFDEYLRLFAS